MVLMNDSTPAGVWVAISGNVAWVAASLLLLLLLSGSISPNAFGKTFVIAQALAVAALADLEYVGLRRAQASV